VTALVAPAAALAAPPAALALPAAVLLAAALDALVAEPPARAHPVVWFGRLVAPFERPVPAARFVGLVAAVGLPLVAAGAAAGLVYLSALLGTLAAVLAAALALFAATSLRMLLDAGRGVVAASEADLDAARTALRALAGRDATALSAGEVRSAAVESLAENLADGLVAPLLAWWLAGVTALLAGAALPVVLALAAAGAWWVKAVNTMDSMLGYRSKPVGWTPARLDDATMWLPARLSALLLALAAGDPGALCRARDSARVPASPNSGWPMATLAAALAVRLRKPGHYALDGGRTLPTVAEGHRAVTVVRRAGLLAVGGAAAGAGLAGVVA
jgi:adenosylcobinamide-phosphate synthase